jgi:hypothetical protein
VSTSGSGVLMLTIKSLTPDDTAEYACKSENNIGQDEKTGTVIVRCMSLIYCV